jgi:hypothetical protein
MIARFAVGIALLLAPGSAPAQTMSAEAAKKFVTGKLFSFNCIDGSHGLGRIYADGSVIGTIQSNPSAPAKSVWLPAGTLRVKGEAICASLKGLSFEPCFNLTRTSEHSFRGAVSGMSMIAYCDFTRKAGVAALPGRSHASAQRSQNARVHEATTQEASAK